MSGAGVRGEGDFETEVCLPVRVRYAVDEEGEVEICALEVMGQEGVKVEMAGLTVHERRSLVELARGDARRGEEARVREREREAGVETVGWAG